MFQTTDGEQIKYCDIHKKFHQLIAFFIIVTMSIVGSGNSQRAIWHDLFHRIDIQLFHGFEIWWHWILSP